ncbi:hypothetical protein F3Y22_tig00111708pilonHSYRG00397 [Hibiscus syriacus]|uniref:RING-type E3 ubiquitin transferase n=1 Tax=Hibiscus syriacus TaxID=106335 RepID=A0A6A2XXP7_HIBSY|nr:hypothetical protein F3Y22_tig00111708pilonHSYRG00397 [Hibiscus syriacus]
MHLGTTGRVNCGEVERREDFRRKEIVKNAFANVGRHSLGRQDTRNDNASTKYPIGRRSNSDTHRNNPKQRNAAYDNANRDGHREKHDDLVPTVPQPALDKVAVQVVEKPSEFVSAKELKKASLQLSVITGLNSNDLMDGFMFGVPNSCCPRVLIFTSARMNLLPKLWDDLFFSASQGLDWLTEGIEAPFPRIRVPSVSVGDIQQEDLLAHSPVLANPTKTVKDPYQNNGEASSNSPQDDASFLEDGVSSTAEEEWKLPGLSMLQEKRNLQYMADNCKRLRRATYNYELTLFGLPNLSEELHETYRCCDEETLFSNMHKGFVCPLTGKLFEDPVTLETGQTFERVAIKEWFNQGNKTCPVTGKSLDYLFVPYTNIILKRVIDGLKTDDSAKNLALAFLIVGNSEEQGLPRREETAIFTLNLFLTTVSKEERLMNAKHLISLGGLPFLIQRFKPGNMEENICVAALLSCCIEADSICRYPIVRDINKQCLFELVCCEQVNLRTNAVLLLVELICLSRFVINSVLNSVSTLSLVVVRGKMSHNFLATCRMKRMNLMHVVHDYLQNSPPVQRPLVATLLLNIDLLVDPKKYGLYRQQAVDAITEALDSSLTDEEVREKCCRALLILGGCFSLTRNLLTEDWILKVAGVNDDREANSEEDLNIGDEDEEHAIAEWSRNLSAALVGGGKKSFLEAISKSLSSGYQDLVTACLTTIAWLTGVLPSPTGAELQQTICTLIPQLKQSLESGEQVKHKIFASMSFLNSSKVPAQPLLMSQTYLTMFFKPEDSAYGKEYRVLLMTIAEEMVIPLRCLADITWTAKELYTITSATTDL